jgi:PAS domain S-box-containing protein
MNQFQKYPSPDAENPLLSHSEPGEFVISSQQAIDLLDSLSEVFYGLDLDWCFIYLNHKAEELSGRKREDLIGKNIWEEFPQGVDTQAYKEMHRALAQQQTIHFETFSAFLKAWVKVKVCPTRIGLAVSFQDITQQKQTEEETRRLVAIIKTSHEAIIGETLAGIITSWNLGAEKIFGYAADEVIQKPITLLIPPEKQGEETILLQKIALGETVENYDTVRLRKDGSKIDISVSLSPIFDENGILVGASKIAQDATERRRVEAEIRASEAALKQAQRVAHVGSWTWHIQSNRLTWSDEMYRIFGITAASFSGDLSEVVSHAIHPDDRAAVESANSTVISNRKPVPLEYRVVWADGTVRVVWAEAGDMLLDSAGNPSVLTGIVQDITERKRIEANLAGYAERLAAVNRLDRIIASSLNIGEVYDKFVSELQELMPLDRTSLVRFNEAGDQWQLVRQWTRHQAKIAVGVAMPVQGSVMEWLVKNRIPYSEALVGEHREWSETAFLHREGIRSRLLLPLILREKVIGVLTVASRQPAAFSADDLAILTTFADQLAIAIQNSDLYEQIQNHAAELEQRVIERTAQLEASNKELEAFSYSVSHDLRSPLRAIDGFARILERDFAEQLPEAAQRYLHLVRDSSQQMGKLIDDLLSFSRLNRHELKKQIVDINGMVRQIFDDLSREYQQRRFEAHIAALPACQADPALLKQVLVNLLSNAIKFTQQCPVTQIDISCQEQNGEWVYAIKDNGAGFDMAYSDKLFGVFQRLHGVEDYPGTGVGLAIVQRIIHRHGGRIWVQAEVDKGATFFFTLEGVTNNE